MCSLSRRVPSSSACVSTLMMSSCGCARRDSMMGVRYSPSFLAAARPFAKSKATLISPTAQRWKRGRSCLREPEQAGDHVHRKREGELAHQLGAAAARERVDVAVHDRADQLVLPLLERLGPERHLDQAAVAAVLGLVHHQDGRAHHQPDGRLVRRWRRSACRRAAPPTPRRTRTRRRPRAGSRRAPSPRRPSSWRGRSSGSAPARRIAANSG